MGADSVLLAESSTSSSWLGASISSNIVDMSEESSDSDHALAR